MAALDFAEIVFFPRLFLLCKMLKTYAFIPFRCMKLKKLILHSNCLLTLPEAVHFLPQLIVSFYFRAPHVSNLAQAVYRACRLGFARED